MENKRDTTAMVPLRGVLDAEAYSRQLELHLMQMWESINDWQRAGGPSREDIRHPGVGMVARLSSHIGYVLREAGDRQREIADAHLRESDAFAKD